MSTEDNVLHSLLDGLTKDDQMSVLRSIQDTRELQIEQKLHPRRRRRRTDDGLLEPFADDSAHASVPEQAPGSDEGDLNEEWELSELSE